MIPNSVGEPGGGLILPHTRVVVIVIVIVSVVVVVVVGILINSHSWIAILGHCRVAEELINCHKMGLRGNDVNN